MEYVQVKMKNNDATTVCWIEKEYANRGWKLELKEDKGKVWTVIEVYGSTMTSEKLDGQRKAQKTFNSKLK
jgi:hypothetical protein